MTQEERQQMLDRKFFWVQEHAWLATGIISFWVPLAIAVAAFGLKYLLNKLAR